MEDPRQSADEGDIRQRSPSVEDRGPVRQTSINSSEMPDSDGEASGVLSPYSSHRSSLKGTRNVAIQDIPTRKPVRAHFAEDDDVDSQGNPPFNSYGSPPFILDESEKAILEKRPDSPTRSASSSMFSRMPSRIRVRQASSFISDHMGDFSASHSISSLSKLSAAEKVKGVLWVFLAAVAAWFTMSSVLLILFGVQYDGLVVDEDRMRYVASAAERAAAAAATVLQAGLAARDAVDHAIKSKLYFEPMDYAAVRATLEPVFAGFPALRAVDLAFTDREDYVTLRRLVTDGESVGSFNSMETARINVRGDAALAMQSSAADCRMLGERGCLSSAPASAQRWHGLASGLWGGEESDGFWEDDDKVFRWDTQPGFVPRDPSRSGATGKVAWSLAYSLVFRTSFPGSSGKLSVLGRSVMELSGLRADESLTDLSLGLRGVIYICDRAGTLLAAAAPGEQVFNQPNGGVFRFRRIGELEAEWASELQDFDGQKKAFTRGGFHVVVQPLSGRGLSNFYAVVAAEREMFIDSRLSPMIESAKIVAVLPYPVFLMVGLGFQVFKEHLRRRNMRRVHVLHEGIATLVNESVGDNEQNSDDDDDDDSEDEDAAALGKLRKRIVEQSTCVKRDAGISMQSFLDPGNTGGKLAFFQ